MGRPAQFTVIGAIGGKRWRVRVVLHETVAELQRAGERYKGMPRGEFANAGGVSQPQTRLKAVGGEWVEGPGAGVVRLARENLTAEVVTHEMVHMGLALYRWSWAPGLNGGPDVDARGHLALAEMANEETLAYLIGEMTQQAVDKLYALGAWGSEDDG